MLGWLALFLVIAARFRHREDQTAQLKQIAAALRKSDRI